MGAVVPVVPRFTTVAVAAHVVAGVGPWRRLWSCARPMVVRGALRGLFAAVGLHLAAGAARETRGCIADVRAR